MIYYEDITKIGKDFTGKKDIAILTNEQSVLESLNNILTTEPGQRVMEPLFGCPLQQYVFEPIDAFTTVSLRNTITNSINKYENRIDNLAVSVEPLEDDSSYNINISFNIKTTGKKQSLNISLNKIR